MADEKDEKKSEEVKSEDKKRDLYNSPLLDSITGWNRPITSAASLRTRTP